MPASRRRSLGRPDRRRPAALRLSPLVVRRRRAPAPTSRAATRSRPAARIFTYPAPRHGAWSGPSTASSRTSRAAHSRRRAGRRSTSRRTSAASGRGTPGSPCPTASTSSTCAPCTACRRRDAGRDRGRCGRHRVQGREPVSPAARPHHRHQRLRPASADRAARTCSCCSPARRSSPAARSGFFVVGVPKGEAERLPQVRAMVDRLNEEDAPVLEHHPLPARPADGVGPPSRALLQIRRGVPMLPAARG